MNSLSFIRFPQCYNFSKLSSFHITPDFAPSVINSVYNWLLPKLKNLSSATSQKSEIHKKVLFKVSLGNHRYSLLVRMPPDSFESNKLCEIDLGRELLPVPRKKGTLLSLSRVSSALASAIHPVPYNGSCGAVSMDITGGPSLVVRPRARRTPKNEGRMCRQSCSVKQGARRLSISSVYYQFF